MKAFTTPGTTHHEPRIDWSQVKDRTPLEMVATNLLGPAVERRGTRLLWRCPFHDDHHPSFEVNQSRKSWRCWVCGIGGDAAELVKALNRVEFPAAVLFLAELAGVITSPSRGVKPVTLTDKPPARPPVQQSGLPLAEASSLVEEATACLWGLRGGDALAYLHDRGLT